jgi:hypothetical protein
MDKQKQIEEMQKDIAVRMAMAKGITGSMNNGVEGWLSEYLIEKGWSQIHEGAIVLTDKKDIQQFEWSKLVDKMGIFKLIEKERKKTRKETAEKFAERLKSEVLNFCGTVEENGYFERGKISFCEDIDEICKELTEGKE